MADSCLLVSASRSPLSDLVVVWLTVSDLLVFVSGAGVVVDELSRASAPPALLQAPAVCVGLPSGEQRASQPQKAPASHTSTSCAVSVICRAVVAALRSATGKAGVSCSALLDPHTFAKALVTLDELLPGGVLETTDEETVHSGAKMKLPISK